MFGKQRLSVYLLKLLVVYSTNGHGTAAKVKDKLTVAIDAHNVALVAGKGAADHPQTHMVAGETLKGVTQKGELFGVGAYNVHEGLHDGIRYGSRTTGATIVDKMV